MPYLRSEKTQSPYRDSGVVIFPRGNAGFSSLKRQINLFKKKDFANLGLDMAILLPAILCISFNNQKFVFCDFDVTHFFLAARIQDLEKKEQW